MKLIMQTFSFCDILRTMKHKKFSDIIDVANHAGVSPATVSRAFNHPDMVKPDTRKRIQKAMEATGYIRNRAAQAIHGKRSGTVGLIVPTLDNAIFANLIQAFSQRLTERDFTMLVATHGYDLDQEYRLLRSLLEHRVEGIGLIGLDHNEETYGLLERRETPAVALWNYDSTSRISCVGSDNIEAGRLIASHIVDLGHRDIALIFPETSQNDRAAGRLTGVNSVLNAAGISVPKEWTLQTKYSVRQARKFSATLFQGAKLPTAIIAGNDVIARGALFEAQAGGLRVPHDVSIAGIGDFSDSRDLVPSLTTVRLRSNKIGAGAADLLLDRIQQDQPSGIARVPVDLELKIRASTDCV